MESLNTYRIQGEILDILKSSNGVIHNLDILWDKFPNEDYDTDIYPALMKLEFIRKIQINRNDEGGILSIHLLA